MKYEAEFIKEMLDRTAHEGVNLTKWEEDFIESISNQFDIRNSLSDKQIDILEKIYTEKVP